MLSSKRRASSGDRTGVFALFHNMPWSAHGRGRVHGNDVAVDKPIEEMPQSGEVLLDGGGSTWAQPRDGRAVRYRLAT
jgi:hypothetical protein